jgi:cell wall assembly regulator SMI1
VEGVELLLGELVLLSLIGHVGSRSPQSAVGNTLYIPANLDPVDAIRRAQEANLVDEDGDAVALELQPALSENEIEALAAEVGAPLPRDLRAVLAYTSGLDGTALDAIDFTGRDVSFEDRDVFPLGFPIAADGFGNFWVLDLRPKETETAAVFFACHDPPIVLYQSADLAGFLEETFRMQLAPHESLVDDVHDDRLFSVWRTNPGETDHATALGGDDELSAFASALDDRFTFVDLRSPEIGMGFSWGRYGPRTEVRRHGFERLFAYAPPEKKPSVLGRLFGRGA